MDWVNDLPGVAGIDMVVGGMAKQLLMEGPVVFQSRFWNGYITIGSLDDYRVWARFAIRMDYERGSEDWALEIWKEERNARHVVDEIGV